MFLGVHVHYVTFQNMLKLICIFKCIYILEFVCIYKCIQGVEQIVFRYGNSLKAKRKRKSRVTLFGRRLFARYPLIVVSQIVLVFKTIHLIFLKLGVLLYQNNIVKIYFIEPHGLIRGPFIVFRSSNLNSGGGQ